MTQLLKRKNVDFLVQQFWRKGYLTLSRKFGTYLPEPTSVGGFDVDVVARQKNKYAIGLTLSDQDLKDEVFLLSKLKYLATRQTRYKNIPVILFVGVTDDNFKKVKSLVEQLDETVRRNIKLFQISNHPIVSRKRRDNHTQSLFS
jgi:hypothetical protein